MGAWYYIIYTPLYTLLWWSFIFIFLPQTKQACESTAWEGKLFLGRWSSGTWYRRHQHFCIFMLDRASSVDVSVPIVDLQVGDDWYMLEIPYKQSTGQKSQKLPSSTKMYSLPLVARPTPYCFVLHNPLPWSNILKTPREPVHDVP